MPIGVTQTQLVDQYGNALLTIPTKAQQNAGADANLAANTDLEALGLYNGATIDRIRDINSGQATSGTGILGVGLQLFDQTNFQRMNNASSMGDGDSGTRMMAVSNRQYNGSNYERIYGNWAATLLASAARTATTSSPNQTNFNARGLELILNVTAASGTGGLQVEILAIDSISGNTVQLNATPTAVTATGTYCYRLGPGEAAAASAGVTQVTQRQLGRTYKVTVVAGDSSSYTYSLSANYLL